MRGRVVRVGAVVVMVAGAAGLVAGELLGAARRHDLARAVDRRRRYWAGRAQGLRYRLGGRRPDPDVDPEVLAARVSSTLGPLVKRLDLPRVHVMVDGHLVYLHGSVDTELHRAEIEDAAMAVSGVGGLVSHLHVGLGTGDTRPSEGAAAGAPSEARRRLVRAASVAGIPDDWAETAARAVVGALADRVPDGELAHLVSHLPADVRPWCVKPRYFGDEPPPRTVPELLAEVVGLGLRPVAMAEEVCLSVYAELQRLVPEEAADIAAVLPEQLRDLWKRAAPAR
jgi:uncharacterized protein (DUF2267 family)